MTAFARFIAIDWSGGRGSRHKGIAVAACAMGDEPPHLVAPPDGQSWSREGLGRWLMTQVGAGPVLAGFDFSFSLPFVDHGHYLPGLGGDARALWDAIEEVAADDADLYGGRFAARHAAHFLTARGRGAAFSPRLRLTEAACRAQGLGRAESSFHLIGPSQVGLGSLAGMRLLRRLSQAGAAVWPFDAPGALTVVELYTRLFLKRAGVGAQKIRDAETLGRALAGLGTRAPEGAGALSDHETDVLVSAAGMRMLAGEGGHEPGHGLWNPPALSDTVRRTEGWTWGVP